MEKAFIHKTLKIAGGTLLQVMMFQGTTFLSNIVLARHFGPSDFGVYIFGTQTLNTIVIVAQLATASVGSRFLGQWYAKDRNLALSVWHYCKRLGILSGLALTLFLLSVSNWYDLGLHNKEQGKAILRICALGSLLIIYSQQILQALAALEMIRSLTVLSVISGSVYLLCTIAGAYIYGITGAISGIVTSYFITTIVLILIERQSLRIPEEQLPNNRLSDSLDEVKKQLLPASISGLLLIPSSWLMIAFISWFSNSHEAGIYSSANQLRLVIMILPQVMNSTGIIIMNRKALTNEIASTEKFTILALISVSLLSMIIGLAASFFIPTIFGIRYNPAIVVVWFFLPSIVFESLILAIRQHLQVKGKFWDWLKCVVLPWQLATGITAYLLIPRYGAVGAAVSYFIGTVFGIMGFLALQYTQKSK